MYGKKSAVACVCCEILFDQLHLCGQNNLFLYMEKMFDIQKIAKVLASKRLKNVPTEYFASYIGSFIEFQLLRNK